MKNIFKSVLQFACLLPLTACSQKDQTMDQLFFDVKGPIKTMTLFQEVSDGPMKIVHHFNEKGELQKIENYNVFNKGEENEIGDVTHFVKEAKNTRYYENVMVQSESMIDRFSLKLSASNKINFIFETQGNEIKIDKKIKYNKLGQALSSISKGHSYGDSNHVKREYFYDKDNKLEYTIMTNYVTDTIEKILNVNEVQDEHGNVTYSETTDLDGKILYIYKRELTYY